MQIAKIVEKYLQRFQDEEERLKPLQDLLVVSGDVGVLMRENMPGHITASGFVVSTCRTKVLRLDHRKLKRLLQPGGHIQAEDVTPLDAAKREVVEETGLKSLEHIPYHADVIVPVDIDIHLIGKTESLPAHSHHDFRYIFLCKDESEFQLNTAEFEGFECRDIQFLETMLISSALRRNPNLSNKQDTKLLRDMVVPGLINSRPGKAFSSVTEFRELIGVDS
jgi:8-oxo-dGTP pyrophosphatase MutT (NUDIX family)